MTELDASIRAGLADRYRVERELGRGGMATVLLATDLKHQRRVAIKVLHPAVAAAIGADRFLREIRVMATLQHPHIVPLFDSGEVAGQPYYVMSFVEGESLQSRLAREGRLGVDEASRITREVASALDFAHRHGIVHRDIKPGNILLADGHALVADFGIAWAMTSDATAADRLTATGISVGTPGYMSPEQVAGGTAVDARTDVYALGAVTHEMLAGEPPFGGRSARAILARVLTEEAPPLSQVRRGIAPAVSAAVQRALASEPSDRFPTAAAFAQALEAGRPGAAAVSPPSTTRSRPVLLGAGLAIAAAVALWAGLRRSSSGAPPTSQVRIAVLQFREAGEPANPGFADGLTTALRSDLATLPGVDVIAGTTISALGDSARVPRYLAEQVGATHVLSGTVQWTRGSDGSPRVLVTPEVVDVRSTREVATRADAIADRVDELFQTEARLSAQIARTLGVPLSAEAVTRLAKPPTRNREAFQAFLEAESAREPLDYLQRAVALDTMFLDAWIRLALRATFSYRIHFRPTEAELVRRASERALQIDSTEPMAQVAALMYQRHVRRDFRAAVTHAAEAIRLAPGDPEVLTSASVAFFHERRYDEALRFAKRAAELDPRNPSALARIENILQWQRNLVAAEEYAGRAIAASQRRMGFINLDSVWLPLMKGDTAAAKGFARSLDDQARADLAIIAERDWLQGWALDTGTMRLGMEQQRRDGDLVYYHLARTRAAWLAGDTRTAARYADSATTVGLLRLRELPDEERLRLAVGYSQALGGKCEAGLAQSDTAHAARSAWKDGFLGPGISMVRAEILAVCGQAEPSLAIVDSLLAVPGFVTPEWLRIDPHIATLRANPRFRALAKLDAEAGSSRPTQR